MYNGHLSISRAAGGRPQPSRTSQEPGAGEELPPGPPPLAPGDVLCDGRYVVEGLYGEGTSSEFWEARCGDRPVMIKVPHETGRGAGMGWGNRNSALVGCAHLVPLWYGTLPFSAINRRRPPLPSRCARTVPCWGTPKLPMSAI